MPSLPLLESWLIPGICAAGHSISVSGVTRPLTVEPSFMRIVSTPFANVWIVPALCAELVLLDVGLLTSVPNVLW